MAVIGYTLNHSAFVQALSRIPVKKRTRGVLDKRQRCTKRTLTKSRSSMGVRAKKEIYTQVEPAPTAPLTATAQSEMNWWMPLAALVVGVLLYKPVYAQLRPSEVEVSQEDDEVSYRRAVARTRQSIYVHRAIGFMNTNAPARVMVELQRALKENAICRSELLIARHSQEDLQGLYTTHLRNDEVPSDYATLLQLREMLGISTETAIKLEKKVNKTDSFVI